MKRIIAHVIIPIVIIALAVFAARKIIQSAAPPERTTAEALAPPVSLIAVEPREMTLQISATGTVVPARQVTVSPEVSGRIIKLSKALVPGAKLRKGAVIARLDPRDYRLAITQEEGRLRQAELELKLEQGRVEIAERELTVLGRTGDRADAVSELARRKPHLNVAEQNVSSAKSRLAKAELNLDRTVIKAPFNAIVLEKRGDVGQFTGPGTPIAVLMGTDALWIDVSVPVERLQHIQVPGINTTGQGSRVEVTHRIGPDAIITRVGHVIRLQGQLDDKNRTASVLVAIDDPFQTGDKTDGDGDLPLLSSAYVSVRIESKNTVSGIELPRQALYDGSYVWTLTADNRIAKQGITIGWRSRDTVIAIGGLAPNTNVVVSPLSNPIDGMKVAPIDNAPALGFQKNRLDNAASKAL
ncbi:MAG: efflux RND transporter periplasmic adaptor subunit [Myxococcota bacterium]|nr:efflux RND transporter periplasmic adaptor subunit [Myxococcota bacterium]